MPTSWWAISRCHCLLSSQHPRRQSFPAHLLCVGVSQLAPLPTHLGLEPRRPGMQGPTFPSWLQSPRPFPRAMLPSPLEARSPRDSVQQMAGRPLSGHLVWRGHRNVGCAVSSWFLFDQIRDPFVACSALSCGHRGSDFSEPSTPRAASQDSSVHLIHFVLLKARPRCGKGSNLNPFIVWQGGDSSRSPNQGKAGLGQLGNLGDSRNVNTYLGMEPSLWP